MPSLAALVMGWLFRGGRGALGDVLSKVPKVAPAGGGGGLSLPRAGAGGPLSIPDLDRINLPSGGGGGNNPYGDLGDVLRRGGGGAGAGGLGTIIRNILGGLLGFGTKGGMISWIIRFVVLRWGWSILKFVLRRMFGMR